MLQDVGVEDHMRITEGLTLRVKAIRRRARLSVTGGGRGLVSRAGTGLVVETSRQLGLERALAQATVGVRPSARHAPAGVLADLAVMLADGGTRLRHLEVLRGQPGLFGEVASVPTATRTLAALADGGAIEGTVAALDAARAQVRRRGWELGALPQPVAAVLEGAPAGPLCLDLDATLVVAHSDDKDGAGKTYKRTWGFHPMTVWLDRGDGTGEALAIELRKGNAGANTATDQIAMVERALAQLPELPGELDVLIRADTAGAVHKLLDHIREVARCRFSVGMPFKPAVRAAIHSLAVDDGRWVEAITQRGVPRKGAAVAEITDLVDLSAWPAGARLLVRREPLHPGAQQTFDDIDGHRFTAFLTDQPDENIAILDARHRAHARVEDRIRCAKNTGLAAMTLDTFERNQLWCQLVLVAADLLVFTQKLALRGSHAIAEPKVLRYQLLHVAGRIVRSGRQHVMHLQADWPWTGVLLAAFRRLRALPAPAG
jgi:hypothetical protein